MAGCAGGLLAANTCRKTPKSTAASISFAFSDYLSAFDPAGYPPALSIARAACSLEANLCSASLYIPSFHLLVIHGHTLTGGP
jgi:hypothetical protein